MKPSTEDIKELKPAEGLCINLPNGRPALQIITYKDVTVRTLTLNRQERNVRLVIDFKEPFIKDKE